MNTEFQVHILNATGIEKAKQIAVLFDTLLDQLKDLCIFGREFSIVRTKLEEASFFAKKSMAILPENQKHSSDQQTTQILVSSLQSSAFPK